MTAKKSLWTWRHTLAIAVIVILIFAVGLSVSFGSRVFGTPEPGLWRLWAWLLTMILLAVIAAITGQGITGQWAGILIDDRNKMSLSRLQMVLWSILVLAAFLIVGLSNVVLDPAGTPLAITIPAQILLAMGISTTSLVGAPLILGTKKATPNVDEREQTFRILADRGIAPGTLGNEGLIVTKSAPQDAQVADLFRGEETGNAAQIDLGKIQMFYVTLILLFAYAFAIGGAFAAAKGLIMSLPRIDGSFVALLAISHAGYLTSKALPHSKTTTDTVTLPPDFGAQNGAVKPPQDSANAQPVTGEAKPANTTGQ